MSKCCYHGATSRFFSQTRYTVTYSLIGKGYFMLLFFFPNEIFMSIHLEKQRVKICFHTSQTNINIVFEKQEILTCYY